MFFTGKFSITLRPNRYSLLPSVAEMIPAKPRASTNSTLPKTPATIAPTLATDAMTEVQIMFLRFIGNHSLVRSGASN